MKKSFLAVFLLLTLASHGTWCAAERSHRINAAHLRPHLQAEELHVTDGKKLLKIQVPRKLGQADEHTHHEGKVPKRMAIAHKGGSTGGGGVAETRPHNGKNSAATVSTPAKTSILALAFTCAIVLSAFSF
ncbi:hypothetical protein E2562_009159 [Oryza meyeriana var. granulata]|uniref:SHSP domain-containing protein n=1 Tax=Oryza meyeriana var. granulata TaxID=110450 RepID=A0A6G1CER2_9ORYZ|nr:hypothetical protein E2562_009159 [Oryza meyeriana var. granulata]